MRRAVSVGLALLLGGAVLAVILVAAGGGGGKKPLRVARGVIGSEKKPFFDDPKVKAAFAKAGLDVQVDTAGSRQIATTVDLAKYDFAFPAGTPPAEKIRRDRHITAGYVPFFTPMAVATFTPIANLLATAGVARDRGGWWSFDVKAFLDLVGRNARWSELPNNTDYPVAKSILITSTDIATSNSAAMYAAIASYVANGNNVVNGGEQVAAIAPAVNPLFSRQGYTETSSEAPFEDYLSIGIGKTPMVMIYEAQFVARLAARDGSIRKDMLLLYPEPDVLSKHTLVPLKPIGDEVGRLLTGNAELQRLAVVHGFRTTDPKAFADFVAETKASVAPQLLNVIEPPAYESLEVRITQVSEALKGPAPSTTATTARK
jgi:hypothetical protein